MAARVTAGARISGCDEAEQRGGGGAGVRAGGTGMGHGTSGAIVRRVRPRTGLAAVHPLGSAAVVWHPQPRAPSLDE